MIPFVCVPYFRSISPNHICNAHKIGVEKLGILWEQHWYYKTSYINRRQKDKMKRVKNTRVKSLLEPAHSNTKGMQKDKKVFCTEHCL